MKLDFAKAFQFNADDPDGWKKVATFAVIYGVCVFCSPLILPAIFALLYGPGFLLQYIRSVATRENKVPDPVSAGGLWHGLINILVCFVYALPLMGVMFLFLGSAVAGLAGAANSSTVGAMGGLAGLGIMGLAACALGLFIAFFAPMVALQYSRNFQFADCFKLGSIFSGMMAGPVDYIVMMVVMFLVHMATGLVTGFLPFLIPFVTPVSMMISANLIGQYGDKVLGMGDDAVATPSSSEVGFSKF